MIPINAETLSSSCFFSLLHCQRIPHPSIQTASDYWLAIETTTMKDANHHSSHHNHKNSSRKTENRQATPSKQEKPFDVSLAKQSRNEINSKSHQTSSELLKRRQESSHKTRKHKTPLRGVKKFFLHKSSHICFQVIEQL
jgi:hypothetical protein